MNMQDVLAISTSVIISLGGGGAIIFLLSGYLGKLWAERLMVQEKAKHERELAEFRIKFEQQSQEKLRELQNQLDFYREIQLKQHNDKLAIYRLVTDIVSELLADMNMLQPGEILKDDSLIRFNRGRLKAHGYLGMLAPQKVMDAYDSLVDYIFSTLGKGQFGNINADWKETRRLAYALINAVRDDIGIDKHEIEYRGQR